LGERNIFAGDLELVNFMFLGEREAINPVKPGERAECVHYRSARRISRSLGSPIPYPA